MRIENLVNVGVVKVRGGINDLSLEEEEELRLTKNKQER
jgi:hypothetical protein